MKVIFINRYFYPDHSATSQLLTDLAFAFAQRDVEIHVIACRQIYDNPAAKLAADEVIQNVRVHRVWTSRFGRGNLGGRVLDYLTFYVSAFFCLLRLAKKNDTIIAKTDPPLISVVAAIVALTRRAKLINWIQDLFPEVAAALGVKGMKGPVFAVLRALRNWSLKIATVNVVIGELMAQRLCSQGIPSERITVIQNWADGDLIRPIAPEDNPLRQEWGLQDKFVVGYSGNLGRAHEFGTVLDAAENLKPDPRIIFLIIGGGAQLEKIKAETSARGLDNFVFKPYQPRERLAESLSVPDVHLISLKPELEGLIVPSKFYGIAAAGRPAIYIGDGEGEIALILQQNMAGFAVAQSQSQGLANTLNKLINKRSEASQTGINARSSLVNYYSRNIAISKWFQSVNSSKELIWES